MSAYGATYALTAAPYGTLLALAWESATQVATLLHLDTALEDSSAGAPPPPSADGRLQSPMRTTPGLPSSWITIIHNLVFMFFWHADP